MKMSKNCLLMIKQLKKLAKGKSSVICPVGKLAKLMDVCERTIRNTTRALEEMGLIRKVERHRPDRNTGKPRRLANEYQFVEQFAGGDGGKFAGYKDLKRFKKDYKDLKQEEAPAAPAPAPISPSQNTYQKPNTPSKRPPFPTTVVEVKAALGDLIDRFDPAVVQHVIQIYGKLIATGHIGNPLAWIKGALRKEQARYNQFGYSGIIKREKAMTFTNFLKAGGHEEAQQAETFWSNLNDDRRIIASQWT